MKWFEKLENATLVLTAGIAVVLYENLLRNFAPLYAHVYLALMAVWYYMHHCLHYYHVIGLWAGTLVVAEAMTGAWEHFEGEKTKKKVKTTKPKKMPAEAPTTKDSLAE